MGDFNAISDEETIGFINEKLNYSSDHFPIQAVFSYKKN